MVKLATRASPELKKEVIERAPPGLMKDTVGPSLVSAQDLEKRGEELTKVAGLIDQWGIGPKPGKASWSDESTESYKSLSPSSKGTVVGTINNQFIHGETRDVAQRACWSLGHVAPHTEAGLLDPVAKTMAESLSNKKSKQTEHSPQIDSIIRGTIKKVFPHLSEECKKAVAEEVYINTPPAIKNTFDDASMYPYMIGGPMSLAVSMVDCLKGSYDGSPNPEISALSPRAVWVIVSGIFVQLWWRVVRLRWSSFFRFLFSW